MVYKIKFDDGKNSHILDESFNTEEDAKEFISQIMVDDPFSVYSPVNANAHDRPIDIDSFEFDAFCVMMKHKLLKDGYTEDEVKNMLDGFVESIDGYNNMTSQERDLYEEVGKEVMGTTSESFINFMEKDIDEQSKLSDDAFKKLCN